MLVLSRKVGERIVIGEDIAVVVAEVTGNRVRLAFDAPRELPIHRGEVYQRIQNDRRQCVPTVHTTFDGMSAR